jgi:hypothetical protein
MTDRATALPTGPLGGWDSLLRIWGPGMKNPGEDIWICMGSCSQRGPLWVRDLRGVEWEDITCLRCIEMIDAGKIRLEEVVR